MSFSGNTIKLNNYTFSFSPDAIKERTGEETANLFITNSEGKTTSYCVSLLDLKSKACTGITAEYLHDVECIVRSLLQEQETQAYFAEESDTETLCVAVTETPAPKHAYAMHVTPNNTHEKIVAVSQQVFDSYQAIVTQTPSKTVPKSTSATASPEFKLLKNKALGSDITDIIIDTHRARIGIVKNKNFEKTKLLEFEQIASFVELSTEGNCSDETQCIDEETAQEIRTAFSSLIPGLSTKAPPLIDVLLTHYLSLQEEIKQMHSIAESKGKKILILAGEDHRDRKCLLPEMMLLEIASDLNIKTLLTKTTDQEMIQRITSYGLDEIQSPNFSYALDYATKLGFTAISCDPEQNNQNITVRTKAINQSIVKANQNSVCFIEVNHLKDILEDAEIKKKYEVFTINLSNITEYKKNHLFRDENSQKEALNYALNSKNAMQIHTPGNPYALKFKELKTHITLIKNSIGKSVTYVNYPDLPSFLKDNFGSNISAITVFEKHEFLTVKLDDTPYRMIITKNLVAPFVEINERDNCIDEGTAQEIRKHFEDSIPGLAIRKKTSRKDFEETYKILYDNINQCIATARKNNKKALILIGENHLERKSLILELMILNISKDLGINNFLIECREEYLKTTLAATPEEHTSQNHEYALEYAKKHKFEMFACDPKAALFYSRDSTAREARASAINHSINIDKDAVALVGMHHLMHIFEDKDIKNNYEVKCIDVSHAPDNKRDSSEKAEVFSLDSKVALRLEIPDNPYSYKIEELYNLVDELSAQHTRARNKK